MRKNTNRIFFISLFCFSVCFSRAQNTSATKNDSLIEWDSLFVAKDTALHIPSVSKSDSLKKFVLTSKKNTDSVVVKRDSLTTTNSTSANTLSSYDSLRINLAKFDSLKKYLINKDTLSLCDSNANRAVQNDVRINSSQIYFINFFRFNPDSLWCVDSIKSKALVLEYKEHVKSTPLTKKEIQKRKFIYAASAFPFPFGFMGAHRVMLGCKPWVPIVYMVTFGGCFGVLPLIDFFAIVLNKDIKQFENNPRIFMWIK